MANTKVTTKSKKAAKKSTASSGSSAAKKSVKNPTTSSGSTASKKTNKKSKAGLICGLIIALILVIIGVIVAVLCLNKPDPSDPTAQIGYSKAFFIYDDGKYTLWNADGKRLTEDEYRNQTDFVGGYALVRKDDEYGIVNENGNMTVGFGMYDSIRAYGGLFLAEGKDFEEQYLITGSGKVLEKGKELEVDAPSSSAGFAVVTVGDKIKVYNYTGTLIVETDKLGDDDDIDLNSWNDFGIMHYGDKNWVFDARDGKMIASFDGKRYSFDTVSEDRSTILLDEYEDSEDYKLIVDGKIYDLTETKYYGLIDNNQVIGYDDYDELALLDNDYKVAQRVSTYIQLKDTGNFAVKKEDGGVAIYRNGQIVKEFGEDASLPAGGLLYGNHYAIEENGIIKLYNLDGSVASSLELKDISVFSDKNHHMIASEDGDKYYILDSGGNRVGDVTASSISYSEGGYKAEDDEGKYAILDKNGNKVTDFVYASLYYRDIAKPRNIWTAGRDDGKVDVIDAENKKVILEGVEIEDFDQNYFSVKNDNGDIEYYTFDGNLFYTEKNN